MMQQPNLDAVARNAAAQLKATYVQPLGVGAFKSAHLIQLGGKPLALKVAALGPNSQARIARECDAQRGCSHAAIASLKEAFSFADGAANYWVWVEEFLPDGTLERRRGSAVMAPESVRPIAEAMIGALGHLRDRKLVHRDIKPANIVFRSDTEPVLTDFGIVRALDLPTLTKHFMMQGPGTPAYAAPEQLNNDIALIDWRTDQFGLAVVLAECLLGAHPFSLDGDIQHAITRVAARERIHVDAAKSLNDIGFGGLGRALEPWPHNRFRTPAAFLEAIKEN